jgi:hypothetical protein
MPSISRECPRPAALAGTRNDLLRQYENGDQGVVFPDQPDVTTNLGGSEIRTQNRFEFGLGARRKSELVTVTNSDLPQGMLAPPQRRAADRRRKRRQLEREKLGLRRFTLWLSLSDRAIEPARRKSHDGRDRGVHGRALLHDRHNGRAGGSFSGIPAICRGRIR